MQGLINLTRWILSICLLIGGLIHIDIFSIIYTLLFLTIPWAFIHSSVIRLRFFFILSLISLITSTTFLLIIGSLHIFSMTNKGENVFSIECSFNVRILKYFGLILWAHTTNKIFFILILIINVIMICSSLATLITHNRVSIKENHHHHHHRQSMEFIENSTIHSDHFQSIPLRIRPIFIYFRSIILLALIHSCGCLVPSILSAFYFFVTLGLAFWWALGKHFDRAYLYIIRLLQIYSIVHLLIIYLYQYPFLEQSFLTPNTQLVRLLGLRSLYKNSCLKNTNQSKDNNWIIYLNPFVILILYWITIYEYYLTRKYHQRLKAHHLNSQNNSQNSNRFHLHSITDLFWIGPSTNDHSQSNIFYKTNSLLVAFISFILSKAYMLSIMSMLLWSITYHSYLTLPYLILACLIWLLPNTKYWCHFCSLFFCIYAYILLIINYIHLLNLIPEEFSWRIHEIEFLHINYVDSISIRFYLKCSIKFIYTLLLLLSLRQRTKERTHKQNISSSSINLYEHIELIPPIRHIDKIRIDDSTSRLNRIYYYLQSQYSSIYYEIYCIFYMNYAYIWFYNLFFNWSRLLTIILIFILSYGSNSIPVVYRIIYMGFFLQYHLCYSLNQYLWNIYLFPFYITLILYSMFVLFIIYIYQFQEFQILKTNICFLHIKCELLLSSLGIRYANDNIFKTELFIPTTFIICIVMHIHFFHREEKKSYHHHSQIKSIQILDFIQYFKQYWKRLENLLWLLCELYIYKIFLLIICFCLTKQTNICLTNFCLIVLFVISLFFPILQIFVLGIYALISSLHILMIMIIRLELFKFLGYIKNVCSVATLKSDYLEDINPVLSARLIAPLEWFGLWTINTSKITVRQLITPYLSVVLGVAAIQLVRRHREKSLSLNELFHSKNIHLFPNIDIQLMNDSFLNTLKYFCNYGTYRFGLELSLFASLCLIIFRMDAIAFIHAIILFIFILLPRQYVRKFWRLYRIFASISAVWLYFNALGLPPVLCLKHIFDRPISTWLPGRLWPQIKVYLYLSDYFEWRPLSEHLFGDFALLIILAIQEINFTLEQQEISVHEMGTNDDEDLPLYRPNLLHDFLTNNSLSWSNRFASFFYSYIYWFILAYLYIIVTYHQSLFYLLILLACFFLLWHGQAFLKRSFNHQKSFWRLLILSFFLLFLAHLLMQPLTCIFVHYTSIQYRCILIQFFNVPCSIKLFQQIYGQDSFLTDKRDYCEGNFHNNSMTMMYTRHVFYCSSNYLIFDAIGFLFVLLFIRLLNSYSFFYVRLELQVQEELSQIGASLLSQLNWLKLIEYRQRTANELESIKARVIQIRQRRTMQKREADIDEPIYHYPAILSGDYYMFDYPLDAPESSNTLIPTNHYSTESRHSITLFDVFDWKAYDENTLNKSPTSHESINEWNNSQWDDELIDNRLLQQSRNAIDMEKDTQNMPTNIDLSSILTFFELKQNSDKIRRALDTMNSRLIIYLGHQVRTLLIISQVISDAKLYLKYPSESAQLITTIVPENINDYIIKACERSPPNRQRNTTTNLPTTNIEEEEELFNKTIPSKETIEPLLSNRFHSRLWTWFRSNIKTTLSQNKENSSEMKTPNQTPTNQISIMVNKHLEKLKISRLHIGPGTILSTFIISKFDYLTYFTLILNFLASGAALIWLPLLTSIYFWAILTVPYPSRRFWHVITLSSMLILLIQYNITFISSLSTNRFIRHSLIGHLNLIANVLLLGVLSFHRIILHQLGLWDDFRPLTEDSLIYQTTFIPSNTKLFRNEIIRGIYSMLKNEIANDQKLQTKNFNAFNDEENNTQRTIPAPSITSILPNDIVDQIKSQTQEEMKNHIPHSTRNYWQKLKHAFQMVKTFYSFAIACPILPKVDHYSLMFLCDFIVIFLIIAGHQRFSHSDSVQDNIIYRYIQGSSSLDITPILMLLTQFLLIIVDRIIYLKKNVNVKFLFLCFQFVVLHIWLVIVYPIWFQREMSKNWAAVSIYILKSFYFMLSALQIRNGYPTRILGNFLTTRYSVLRLLCYKLYCTIPFLYEMRVLMDWMFIPTSLSLTYYFMMEEIARNAWTQKCWRITEARSPTKRAQNRGRCERYCVGGWILFAIIFVIWFPLVFFSVSTSLADPIPIDRCEIKVRLSTYKELYQLVTMNVREPNLDEFLTDIHPLIINSSFASGPRDFTAADVACIHALGNVGAHWTISVSALNQLKKELKNYIHNIGSMIPQIYFDYSFIRKGQTSEQDVLPSGYTITLSGTHNVSLTKENAMALLTMLASENQTKETIIIGKLMPKFIHLLPDMIDIKSPTYPQDIQLTLRREKQLLWWDISEVISNDWKTKCSFNPQALNLITVSERAGAQSKSFNLISKLLIGSNAKLTLIGVYAGLVYVLWLTCFRQTLFSDIQLIMYHEWPFADRIEKLCEEVYLVRELGELQLEEELFARLIFLHRSPETLVRFTRPKAMTKKQEQFRNKHLHQN